MRCFGKVFVYLRTTWWAAGKIGGAASFERRHCRTTDTLRKPASKEHEADLHDPQPMDS